MKILTLKTKQIVSMTSHFIKKNFIWAKNKRCLLLVDTSGLGGFKTVPEKTIQNSLTQCVDLPEVFEYLGLSKYTDVFVQQEVKIKLLSFN